VATLYGLKPRFQALLRPLVRRLAAAGCTPNAVTWAGFLLSAAGGAALAAAPGAAGPLLALPAVLLVRMALNAIDGMLAREHGMRTRLGAMLNETGDVASDLALYLPLALAPQVPAAALVAAVACGVVAEVAGLAALAAGAARRYDGPLGKSDRAFAFGALGLALGLGAGGAWVGPALWLLAALGLATAANRVRAALREGAPP